MTARAMTSGEKASVRSNGQHSRLYLALHSPAVVMTARLNGAPTSPDQVVSLSIDTVVGTLADVYAGMTLWVGTSTWAWDKGRCRIRKAPITGTLYVGETSDIEWADNDYLTVVAEYRCWPRHLITAGETGVWMDYDVAYTDQHTYPAPVVNMGPDAVAWLDPDTGLATVEFDASASFAPWGSIASFSWSCDTAASIIGGSTSTPTMTFDVTSVHDVRCTATTAAGKTHTGHRMVFVFDHLSQPITQFALNGAPGTSFGAGPGFSVTLYAEAGIDAIPPCAKAILFSRDWYEGAEGSYGPNGGRDNILAVGWVESESIQVDPDTGNVSFDVSGLHEWMRRTPMFATGLMDTDFADGGGGWPDRWVEMNDLAVDKAIWHLLHWCSTVSIFTDIFLTGDTRQASELSASSGDLWSQLQELAEATILAAPTVDRFGALHVAVNQAFLPESDRGSIPTVLSLEGQDWSEMTIARRVIPEYYKLRASGVEYAAGVSVPIGAIAPGYTPADSGNSLGDFSELVMGTQAQALVLAGVIAGAGAAEIESIEIVLAENNRFFDVAPHQWVELILADTDTVRGVPAGTYRLIVREVRYDYDPEKGYIKTALVCEGEGGTWPAIPMMFPGDDEPGIEPPPEPPPDDPPPPDPGGGGDPPPEPPGEPADAIVSLGSDVLTTADFSASSPAWDTELGSGPTAIIGSDVASDKSAYYVIEEGAIWKSVDFQTAGVATWSKVFDGASFSGAGWRGLALRCSQQHTGLVYVLAVDDSKMTYCGRSNDSGGSWVWNEVATQTGKDYTVSYLVSTTYTHTGYNQTAVLDCTHQRPAGATCLAISGRFHVSRNGGWWYFMVSDAITAIPAVGRDLYSYDVVGGEIATFRGLGHRTAAEAALTDYFGAGAYNIWLTAGANDDFSMPDEDTRVRTVFHHGHAEAGVSVWAEEWAIWDYPSYPRALAVSPTNDNYVYIGTTDGIYKSIDGGYTWSVLTSSYGANDLYSPWGTAGVVYFWGTDGKLGYYDVDTEVLLGITESPAEQTSGRIGVFGGKLYVLTGGKVRMKSLGSWSDLKTGVLNAQGLRVYSTAAGTLVFVETNGIWYSNDGGSTWANKQGDIAGLSGALTVHLL